MWDEKLTATDISTFHDVAAKLCESAIQQRRNDKETVEFTNTCGVSRFILLVVNRLTLFARRHHQLVRPMTRFKPVMVLQEEELKEFDSDLHHGARAISVTTRLVPSILPEGSTVEFTYDYGHNTILYLKVLSVRPAGARSLLSYFQDITNQEANQRDLQSIPAYHLPKEKQLDAYFPNFSKACLGFHVPLFEGTVSTEINTRDVIGSITMGPMACIRSEDDRPFLTMENFDCSLDLLHWYQAHEHE